MGHGLYLCSLAVYMALMVYLLSCLPNRFIHLGVMGRVHNGWRQGPTLDESPVHWRVLCEHWWVRYLAQGYFSNDLKVFILPCFICPGARTENLRFSGQSPTAWATTAQLYVCNCMQDPLHFLKIIPFAFWFYFCTVFFKSVTFIIKSFVVLALMSATVPLLISMRAK